MFIINQSKLYIFGDVYWIDWYDDGTFGCQECIFTDTIQEMEEILRSNYIDE